MATGAGRPYGRGHERIRSRPPPLRPDGAGHRPYLERIDATLAPFGGRFIIHGATPDVREGDWPGDLIVIEFPDRERATGWYESPAYQEILPLRTENSDGTAIVVDGVPADHRATDVLER